MNPNPNVDYDVVVVGGGPAGATAADELAARIAGPHASVAAPRTPIPLDAQALPAGGPR